MIALDLPPRRATPHAEPKRPRATGFSGAASNRLTGDWIALILSADRETRGSLRTLRARSRQLCRDNSHAAGLVNSLKDNITGAEGIGLMPRMRSPRGLPMKAENLAAWNAFTAWGERGTCTADGQNSWPEFQRLVLGTWVTDGECFVRRLPGFDNAFGYALQILDADQLDESYNIPPDETGAQTTQGIQLNSWGRPIAYYFWDRHPSDGGRRRIRIAAEDIYHLFLQLRPNQRRGLPLLTPALIALKMLDGYTEAEITAARLAAAKGGFYVNTLENGEDPMSEEDQAQAFLVDDAQPGERTKLPVGWRYEEVDPAHPNGNFVEFQKSMLRVISCATGTSYITLSHDLSDTSYSSGRVGLLAERDAFKAVQSWLGNRLVVPIYRDVLRFASLSGQLQLPTPEVSRWWDCRLEPRGWPWVAPKEDVIVADLEVGGMFNSPQRICAALGRDYEEIVDEIAEAKAYCEAAGLEWPAYGTPQGGAPQGADTATPQTNPNMPKAQAPRLMVARDRAMEATA